jgi:hypothetical protein
MRAWKIHLCWGLVAMVTAGAWGRWTAARREADGGVRLVSVAAAPEEPPQARSDPPPPTVNAPRASLPPSTVRLLPNSFDLPVDEIRVRMKSSDVHEAYHAVERIIKLKDPALKRELLLECIRSSHPQVREIALGGLVEVMGDEAVPIVQGILVSDPERFVRRRAAELLGGLPDKGSTELLLDAYRTSEGGLKIAAASSLYRFGNPAPAAELLPLLAADLDSADGTVRKDAVERIGKLQAPMAIPVLTRALRDSSGDVRAEAATALGEIDAPEVPALLESLLKDPYIDARDNAKDAIEAYRQRHPK